MTGVPKTDMLPANTPLFTVPAALVKILDRDLKLAGIAKRDDRGRTVDVHALRHCFGTMLSRSGVAPRTAQAALRHSTIDLTMNVYTDPRLLDVHAAVESLPELPLEDRPQRSRQHATGTFGAARSSLHQRLHQLQTIRAYRGQSLSQRQAKVEPTLYPPERSVSVDAVKRNNPLSAVDNGLDTVERKGVEPSTFALRTRRSPN